MDGFYVSVEVSKNLSENLRRREDVKRDRETRGRGTGGSGMGGSGFRGGQFSPSSVDSPLDKSASKLYKIQVVPRRLPIQREWSDA